MLPSKLLRSGHATGSGMCTQHFTDCLRNFTVEFLKSRTSVKKHAENGSRREKFLSDY